MEEKNVSSETAQGLSERLMREMMRTPAMKELVLLQLRDIDPDTAPGFVRTMLWEDPGVSLSLFGALPDTVNWLLEFLLEMGRQFNGLPEPLLRDFLGRIGEGIDPERLKELPQVYGQLLGRLLADEETAGEAQALVTQMINAALSGADQLTSKMDENREELARSIAAAMDETDPAPMGRIFDRMVKLSNAVRRARKVTMAEQCRVILSQMDAREVMAAAGGFLRDSLSVTWAFISWSIKGLRGKK
jgi:hypothetical protein